MAEQNAQNQVIAPTSVSIASSFEHELIEQCNIASCATMRHFNDSYYTLGELINAPSLSTPFVNT